MVSYREHPPPPALRPWLACTWERRGDGGAPVRVLPDGCIDVVWTEGQGTLLVGANTTAFLVPVAPGARVVGARLRPGAAPALLDLATAEALTDARLPVETALGDPGAHLAATLETAADPVALLPSMLLARATTAPRPDPLTTTAIARLATPRTSIEQLAADLGLSERQLRRRVTAAVGYGPKRLARVLRLHRALRAARADDDLARAALDAGYADQGHFATDCRLLAGVPPSALA